MPVANHFSTFACFDELLQTAVEQLLACFLPLYVVDTDALIDRGEGHEVLPYRRIGLECGEDFGHDDKLRIKIRTNCTSRLGHQAEPFEPPATLLVQFGPHPFSAPRPEALERHAADSLYRRVNPSEAQSLFHGIEISQDILRRRLAPPCLYPALLLRGAVRRQPLAEVGAVGDVEDVFGVSYQILFVII